MKGLRMTCNDPWCGRATCTKGVAEGGLYDAVGAVLAAVVIVLVVIFSGGGA